MTARLELEVAERYGFDLGRPIPTVPPLPEPARVRPTIACAVRLTVRASDLETEGWNRGCVSHEGRSRLGMRWVELPPGARLTVDLGPVQRVDEQFLRDLAAYPFFTSIIIESPDPKIAAESARVLMVLIDRLIR